LQQDSPAEHFLAAAGVEMTRFHRFSTRAEGEDASVRCDDADVRIGGSGSQPTVAITGRITVDSSPYLRSVLLGRIAKSAGLVLVIDVSGVTHIDMSGLATLLEALNSAHEHSVSLRLAGMGGEPRRLAELAQLDQIFRALGSEVEFR
jgi:anti-sigma B factor antagonist